MSQSTFESRNLIQLGTRRDQNVVLLDIPKTTIEMFDLRRGRRLVVGFGDHRLCLPRQRQWSLSRRLLPLLDG